MPPSSSPPTTESDLLSHYLHLLNTYTTQQSALHAHLRSAFLSLAKARFHAGSSGSSGVSGAAGLGARFGADSFDARARAALRVKVKAKVEVEVCGDRLTDLEGSVGSASSPGSLDSMAEEWECVRLPYSVARRKKAVRTEATTTDSSATVESLSEGVKALGLDASKVKDDGEREAVLDEKVEPTVTEEEEEEVIANPLFQFGMLVPQALRTAQSEFTACAEVMVRLVGVERRMREVEGWIEALRVKRGGRGE